VTLAEDGLSDMVKSNGAEVGKTFKVTFSEIANCNGGSCDSGDMVGLGVPCSHAVAAATKKGVPIETLLHRFDTADGWRAQYVLSIELPSSAQVDSFAHLIDSTLRMPLALTRGRGRPKTARRISYVEKYAGKKRRMTCQHCYKTGHTKRTCPSKPSEGGGGGAAANAAAV
jgi:hypothetical protein